MVRDIGESEREKGRMETSFSSLLERVKGGVSYQNKEGRRRGMGVK